MSSDTDKPVLRQDVLVLPGKQDSASAGSVSVTIAPATPKIAERKATKIGTDPGATSTADEDAEMK